MKRFFLFGGAENNTAKGIHTLAGDFDSVAEAFLSMIDSQKRADWWHILDTQTGEVIDRRHLRAKDTLIGFARSDWHVGSQKALPVATPLPVAGAEKQLPKEPALEMQLPETQAPEKDSTATVLEGLAKSLQTVATVGVKVNGQANGKAEAQTR